VLAARDRNVTFLGGSVAQKNRIVLVFQFIYGDVKANVHTAAEADAFGFHKLHPTLDSFGP
jgi:hypothetical protein